LFFGFSVLDLVLTAAGSYFLTISNSNTPTGLFAAHWYLLTCLLLIFVSISFFITLIIKNISYLQPHRAIFLLTKNISYEDIRDYLWKKYPLEYPFNLRRGFIRIIDHSAADDEGKIPNDMSISLEGEEKEGERNIEKEIKAITRRVTTTEDPLLLIRDMMIQFVRRADLSSLSEAQTLLLSVSKEFVERVPKNGDQKWSPSDVLLSNFTRYLIELLSAVLEIAEKEGLESGKKLVLGVCYEYAEKCFEFGCYRELELVHKFLLKVADASIGQSPFTLQNIIEHYQKMGEKSFRLLKEKPPEKQRDNCLELLDDLFRDIGWLGERLLMKLPIEPLPLMINFGYSTEFDSLFNCLLAFDRLYSDEQPGAYPLIYFDALMVVIKQIVNINHEVRTEQLDEKLFEIIFTFEAFASAAIKAGNSKGASLAALRIKESLDEITKAGLKDLTKEPIGSLVRVGMNAAGNQEKLKEVEFMSGRLDLWAIDTLAKSGANIDHEVMDSYIHSTLEVKNHDAVWEFITKLGVRMGTNFGFIFDCRTGELYPEGDPRRR